MTEHTDVIVVGAGVAGLLAAWRLAKAGVKVLVLEAGSRGERHEALAAFHRALVKTPESPYPPAPHAPQPSVLHPDRYCAATIMPTCFCWAVARFPLPAPPIPL